MLSKIHNTRSDSSKVMFLRLYAQAHFLTLMNRFLFLISCFILAILGFRSISFAESYYSKADYITLQGLDKVTARVFELETQSADMVQFGHLTIEPQICYVSSPSDPPESIAFIEIREHTKDQPDRLLFSGWMFASSPGITSLEHPVYDVWLKGCRLTTAAQATPAALPENVPTAKKQLDSKQREERKEDIKKEEVKEEFDSHD